ncbi:AI-2E family transporter [Bradyrhizobium sp. SYSU BS000235]|uniref:AI-2E family transporter n=1 Tax=Bradyrhizobium sp. SYSU BS000235 TaxID=3411332 RepID=UPI003C75A596
MQLALRLGLLAFLIYWSFVLVRPFIPILVWALILTVALYAPHRWLAKHLGDRPKTAAAMLTIAFLAIVIGPMAWLSFGLIEAVSEISRQIDLGGLAIPPPPARLQDLPLIGVQMHDFWKQASSNLATAFREIAPFLKPIATAILAFAGSAGTETLKFLASIILAGFLLPMGPTLVKGGHTILARVAPQRSEHLLSQAGATIRTVAQGVIGIAILQSILAGLGLKLAGVPGASLIAFAVLVLGILQLGAVFVLLPVIIWIWMEKDFTVAMSITAYLIVVGLADNALKPLLMGRGLTTPTLVILIGVLGGMLAHGIIGLFVGPIILAAAWELLMAWMRDDPPNRSLASTEGTVEILGRGHT